ncbi:UDP-N-acetylmuramoyl-tripeptide--D-alanyl-D-alanine ligase [candidate division WOR-3 bacterium]|uniref:UDP-N-acetylmuramoyl-tripeptide--D-alanyl-D-alanine ligase n=1 Tax=candidate division WOR-3 bacterium TaxID=2052148 RepID=A0A660SHG7_UNCW3|nr:MAG: UDP-N-acetylmuramoyl-tripeptide--D-alanyl-D-alanine ligase [candidate division WOR-3 bacterium]
MFTLAEITKMTQGVLKGREDLKVVAVEIDSRRVRPGSLFIAIRGERFDGHEFVEEAIGNGAVAVMAERDLPLPNLIRVEDTIIGLGKIAQGYLSRFTVKKVGITGTNGKTTTKALIGSILSREGSTCVAEKSYNNAIGLPLTILGLKKEDQFLILEYGTNHPGEIGYLLRIAVPDIGVLTNVGPGHLEGFGTVEAVRREKFTLLEAIPESGGVVYPFELNPDQVRARRLTFGIERGDITARIISMGEEGSVFEVGGETYQTRLLGRGNIKNCLAAIGVAQLLGIDPDKIRDGLKICDPIPGRLHLIKKEGVKILDDSYNSNPASLKEALDLLPRIEAQRRILVLGDMLELGPDSPKIHEELGVVMRGKADLLLTYGDLAQNFTIGFGAGEHFETKGALISWLNKNIRPGDLILVKGSRRMAMEEVVKGVIA